MFTLSNLISSMKKFNLSLLGAVMILGLLFGGSVSAQQQDTLAYQDFEVVPQAPVWTYTGTPNDFQSGTSSASATPANSPLGINNSRAWHLRQVSGGNPVVFANTTIPAGYDSVRIRFRLAGMNLNGTSGGPDHLDYVLVAYSIDGGNTFVNRLRVRGAVSNNCSWPYSAASTAKNYYLPGSEQVFQPQNSGLQLQAGLGTVEIVFPGSITQLMVRITPRSSSSSDSWLIDNLALIGDISCTPSTATIAPAVCDSYTSPSGNHIWTSSNTYMDTIPNAVGCDSVITVNLTVTNSTSDTLTETVCDSYTSPSGNHIWTSSNVYLDTIPNAAGCDSLITIDLTVNNNQLDTLTESACGSYIAPSGAVYSASGTYADTIPTAAGCDSMLTIMLTINNVDTSVTATSDSLSANAMGATYQWIDCGNGNQAIAGATSQGYAPSASGSYAVIVTEGGCTDTSGCRTITLTGIAELRGLDQVKMWPNPATEILNLDLGSVKHAGTVEVFDLTGKVLQSVAFQAQSSLRLPISTLPAGLYVLVIESDGNRIQRKFQRK